MTEGEKTKLYGWQTELEEMQAAGRPIEDQWEVFSRLIKADLSPGEDEAARQAYIELGITYLADPEHGFASLNPMETRLLGADRFIGATLGLIDKRHADDPPAALPEKRSLLKRSWEALEQEKKRLLVLGEQHGIQLGGDGEERP